MRRSPPLLIAALTSVMLTACGEAADTHPGQPVSERRAAFKKILLAFEPMGVQLRDKQYDPDRFIALAAKLGQVKNGPWSYFGDDSNYPPTRAKASVWSDSDRFADARRDFLQTTDRLVLVAESRDEAKVAAAYEAIADSCRSCHQAFRK
jgi:cytochrome c556